MTRTLLWLLILALCGCASDPTLPDLSRLYAHQAGGAIPPPLIVIHGVLGGRLADRDSGEEVWPGRLRQLVFSSYDALRLDIDASGTMPAPSPLIVDGITDSAAGRDFYGRILTTLEDIGGYRHASPGTAANADERRYYVYSYDWRQDNLISVRGLDDLVERIRDDYGNPDLKVDIVAHSMGGLITRYFVRYGTDDVLNDNDFPVVYDGDRKVRRVILLGTPNLGSIASLAALVNGRKVVLGRIDPEVIASFPSAYQVLPHKLRNWLIDADGNAIDADVFDIDWWRDLKLGIFAPETRERIVARHATRAEGEAEFARFEKYFDVSLERGRRFSWSLTVQAPHIAQRYIVFGGSCKLTVARGLLERDGERSYLRFSPKDIRHKVKGLDYDRLMLEPGDGTVTKASLLARQILDPTVARHQHSFFPLGFSIFLCEDHSMLTGNLSFQDNLLNALLSADPH